MSWTTMSLLSNVLFEQRFGPIIVHLVLVVLQRHLVGLSLLRVHSSSDAELVCWLGVCFQSLTLWLLILGHLAATDLIEEPAVGSMLGLVSSMCTDFRLEYRKYNCRKSRRDLTETKANIFAAKCCLHFFKSKTTKIPKLKVTTTWAPK